jgi:hypothetical protein
MLAAIASHRWTGVIVLVSAAMLATTLGIGGLVRWRARESEGSQTARELSLSSLTGIAIGMAVLWRSYSPSKRDRITPNGGASWGLAVQVAEGRA